MVVNVLLSGRLKLDGYGQAYPKNKDGTLQLALEEGCTLPQAIRRMGVPPDRVALAMVNGHLCRNGLTLKPGDRVVLVPPDVAALWRHLGTMNMGMESVFEF